METPPRNIINLSNNDPIQPQRKYTEEEKKQLLTNLELEVQDRIRQFEAYLAHSLEAFRLRHENEVTRIPRAIRGLTIGEFADKYDGDVNKGLQAITKARLEANEDSFVLDETARKRKRDPTNEPTEPTESDRVFKNARLTSPMKKDVGGNTRSKLAKTPVSRLRQPPPSPRMQSVKSPYKALSKDTRHPHASPHRVPSLSQFNPTLPKTPAYPPQTTTDDEKFDGGGGKLQRQRSIAVLRGPSLAHPGSRQGARTFEMILSLKVYTKSGDILEFDPLSTTVEDLDQIEDVTEESRKRAKEELLELTSLMEKLGKWRI